MADTFDEALRTHLLADDTLASLVTDVVWDERPETGSFGPDKTLGIMVLTLVAPGRDYTHDGWDGLDQTLVQFDAWHRDPDAAAAIARATIGAIEVLATVNGWEIGPAFLEADSAERDELDGAPLFRRRQDWTVMNRPVG